MRLRISSLVSSAREAYAKDKPYYRGLIVRAIEDAIVLYLGFAAVWALAHVVSGVLQKLGAVG